MNVTKLLEDFQAPECVDVDTPEKEEPALPIHEANKIIVDFDITHITLRKKNMNINKRKSYVIFFTYL